MLTAVFADSTIAGPGETIPAVREALSALGMDSDFLLHAMPWRTTPQQLPYLDAAVRARPDLVILANGGADGMMVRRPPGAGHITKAPVERPLTEKRRDLVHRAKLGNRRPAVPWRVSERAYRRVVSTFLDSTDAHVVLIGPAKGADRVDERHRAYRLARFSLIAELERSRPERVAAVWPDTVMHFWDDFRSDQSHLTASGQSKIAQLLVATLQGILHPGGSAETMGAHALGVDGI